MVKEELELSGALLTTFLGSGLDNLVQSDGDGDSTVDNVSNADEIVLSKASAGHGRGTHAETAGNKGRAITGNGVLVGGDANKLENALDTATIDTMGLQVGQNQVVVGAATDKAVSKTTLALVITKALGKSLGIGKDLRLVGAEVGGLSLLESDRQGSDGVVVGTALVAGEDGGVDGVLKVVHLVNLGLGVLASDTLAEEDERTAGTTETLVAGGGDDVSILEGAGEDLGGDQARDVGHIGEHVGVDLVANFADALVVNETAVSTGASDNDLGAVEEGRLLKLVVVDEASLLVEAVREGLEVLGDGRDLLRGGLVTVGQMTTMGQIKTHESVVGVHQGRVDVEVGRSTRESC